MTVLPTSSMSQAQAARLMLHQINAIVKKDGLLGSKYGESEWVSPTFVVVSKDMVLQQKLHHN